MKERFRARVLRDGCDRVGLLDLAFLQPVFEAGSGNDDARKALVSKFTEEFHVPWKFALHVVDGSIVGESAPRQVYKDLRTSEPLESITRRCFEVELHEVPSSHRFSPSRAKNLDNFVALVRERRHDMTADEASGARQGDSHRVARSIALVSRSHRRLRAQEMRVSVQNACGARPYPWRPFQREENRWNVRAPDLGLIRPMHAGRAPSRCSRRTWKGSNCSNGLCTPTFEGRSLGFTVQRSTSRWVF